MALELTTENFDSVIANGVTLVDFWAPWCGPCKMLTPAIEQIAADFDGRANVGKVNVDDVPELAEKYGIRGVPTVLVFKDGELLSTTVGSDKKKVRAALEAAL